MAEATVPHEAESPQATRLNSSQRKSIVLGMPFGTACHRLRKSIMFMLVQETKRDTCHQCGRRIETADELSIEHIEIWESSEDPLGKFFDLSNISFSHLLCNIGAAQQPTQRFPSRKDKDRFHARAANADPVRRERKNEWRRKKRAAERSQGPVAQPDRAGAS